MSEVSFRLRQPRSERRDAQGKRRSGRFYIVVILRLAYAVRCERHKRADQRFWEVPAVADTEIPIPPFRHQRERGVD